MDQTFISNLSQLRQSDVDVVLPQLNKLFLGISQMDEDQVIAAFQTVRCTAALFDLSQDVAIIHVMEALRQRMVALVNKQGAFFGQRDLALTFCAVLGITVEYQHEADKLLMRYKVT